jgi:hypothetical protein
MQREVKRALEGIDVRVHKASAEYVAANVEPRLNELWERDEQIAETMNEFVREVSVRLGMSKTTKDHVSTPGSAKG